MFVYLSIAAQRHCNVYVRSKVALGHNLALSSNKSRETREISPQKSHRQFGALSHIYLRVMLANLAHSHLTRKLSRQVGTLSSTLTVSILRESSRQHWYTLFSVQTPYSEAMPGKSLAHFHSLTQAKQANPASSLPIFIQKASWGNTHMPQLRFPSESHSGATRILSTRIPCGSHAGTIFCILSLIPES